jgi:hypothetical protein
MSNSSGIGTHDLGPGRGTQDLGPGRGTQDLGPGRGTQDPGPGRGTQDPGNIEDIIVVVRFPIITNFTIPTKTFGDVPFIIIPPTSNSDGSFTYSSSNPLVATIVNGNYINIVGSGTSTIEAIQNATNNYTSGSIQTSFVVDQDTPTNPVVVDNGDGLLYFMNTTSTYCNIIYSLEISSDLIAYSTSKVLFANNENIKIIKSN